MAVLPQYAALSRPGLKTPCGSKLALSRASIASSAAFFEENAPSVPAEQA
jgi:hypothetical protein